MATPWDTCTARSHANANHPLHDECRKRTAPTPKWRKTVSEENNPQPGDSPAGQDSRPEELQPSTQQHAGGQGEAEHSTGEPAVEQAAGEQAPEEKQPATEESPASESQQAAPTEQATQDEEPAEDLFDLLGDEGKKYKKKKPEQKKGSTSKDAEKEKKEPTVYRAGTEVAYAGHKMNLPSDMNEEQILKFLEDPFPELADKEQTEFRYDAERNRIVPTRKALKKGAGCGLASAPALPRTMEVLTQAPKEPLPSVHRRLAADGIYEVRDTSLGVFTARLPAIEHISESVRLKLPKPPAAMLSRIVQLFKQSADSEELLTIVYDHDEGRHRLVRVEQQTSPAKVHYDALVEDERYTIFCEIHSHHRMPPFFSEDDDSSEAVSGGLFGVIGDIRDAKPAAIFRYSCGGHFRVLHARQLFEPAYEVPDIIRDGAP